MKFDPLAAAEIREAANWLDEQRTGVGDAFTEALLQLFDRIDAMPLQFPSMPEDERIHKAFLRRFDYLVYFILLQDGTPWTLAVHHMRREPMYWADRFMRAGRV
ncbi:MAG: hypothetical protein FWD73_10725 [Polyangiaceae bacterium]|nr:hypothetical protein [Polyangiaceae bacterium]